MRDGLASDAFGDAGLAGGPRAEGKAGDNVRGCAGGGAGSGTRATLEAAGGIGPVGVAGSGLRANRITRKASASAAGANTQARARFRFSGRGGSGTHSSVGRSDAGAAGIGGGSRIAT